MDVWHITLAARNRGTLLPREASRREGVRRLAQLAGEEMLLFSIVHDHVHVVLAGDRARVGAVAAGMHKTLRPLVRVALAAARIRAVAGRSHLWWLVRYVLGQPQHHGIDAHPALWTGSCLPDLIGARRVSGLQLRIREHLPELQWVALARCVDLSSDRLMPASPEQMRAAGVAMLTRCATSALAADPSLAGNSPLLVRTRKVVACLASESGFHPRDVAWALGVTLRGERRLRAAAVDEADLIAVRVRLALELVAASRPTSVAVA